MSTSTSQKSLPSVSPNRTPMAEPLDPKVSDSTPTQVSSVHSLQQFFNSFELNLQADFKCMIAEFRADIHWLVSRTKHVEKNMSEFTKSCSAHRLSFRAGRGGFIKILRDRGIQYQWGFPVKLIIYKAGFPDYMHWPVIHERLPTTFESPLNAYLVNELPSLKLLLPSGLTSKLRLGMLLGTESWNPPISSFKVNFICLKPFLDALLCWRLGPSFIVRGARFLWA